MNNYDAVNPATENFDMINLVPHCPVILVLDTSHSMWGQGLIDLRHSLIAFYQSVSCELFQEAQIDIEAIRMGENFGVMESFTPMAASALPGMTIRPKGDTPLGASLELAISELDRQLASYRQQGIGCVTPQLIVLSDGKSSDDFHSAAEEIRKRTEGNRLLCRAIALGKEPDLQALAEIAGDAVMTPQHGALPEIFREVGRVVSQEYESAAAEIIIQEAPSTVSDSPRHYLLDGTNMIYWDELRTGITLDHVQKITDYLKTQNEEFTVYFDATTPYVLRKYAPTEEAIYQELLTRDPEHFRQVPAGTRADDILLVEADQHPEITILSNDRYRDYEEQYPWLSDRKRVAPGMVLCDKIFFPKINLKVPRTEPEKR